jgi:predicted phage terminase large subunit-like protein
MPFAKETPQDDLGVSLEHEDSVAYYARFVFLGQHHSRQLIGFRQAARTLFFKDFQRLNLPEAATLVGLLPDPLQRNPYRHPERAMDARNCILSAMVDKGDITSDLYKKAAASPLRLTVPSLSARHAFDRASIQSHGWRADAVLVGLSQRGVLSEPTGDVKRGEFMSPRGDSEFWFAEFYSPTARTLKTIQIVGSAIWLPDVETLYAHIPERFTDLHAIGDNWIDSTDAVHLAMQEAKRNNVSVERLVPTAALTRVGTAPPEWTIRFRHEPKGDKTMRMHSVTSTIENGFVYLPDQADWLDEYRHELATFPRGKYDDQCDSTSQALDWVKTGSKGVQFVQLCKAMAERAEPALYGDRLGEPCPHCRSHETSIAGAEVYCRNCGRRWDRTIRSHAKVKRSDMK